MIKARVHQLHSIKYLVVAIERIQSKETVGEDLLKLLEENFFRIENAHQRIQDIL